MKRIRENSSPKIRIWSTFSAMEKNTSKRDVPKRKYKVKESKERSGDAVVVFDEQKERYDSVGVLVASCN